jgi:hypothetical protein
MDITPIALQVTVEAGAADTKNLSGAKAVAIAHLEHLLDVNLANLIQRESGCQSSSAESEGTRC